MFGENIYIYLYTSVWILFIVLGIFIGFVKNSGGKSTSRKIESRSTISPLKDWRRLILFWRRIHVKRAKSGLATVDLPPSAKMAVDSKEMLDMLFDTQGGLLMDETTSSVHSTKADNMPALSLVSFTSARKGFTTKPDTIWKNLFAGLCPNQNFWQLCELDLVKQLSCREKMAYVFPFNWKRRIIRQFLSDLAAFALFYFGIAFSDRLWSKWRSAQLAEWRQPKIHRHEQCHHPGLSGNVGGENCRIRPPVLFTTSSKERTQWQWHIKWHIQ